MCVLPSRRTVSKTQGTTIEISSRVNISGAECRTLHSDLGEPASNISRCCFIFLYSQTVVQTVKYISVSHYSYSISTTILHDPCSFPIFRKRSNAIRRLERDSHYQATVPVWPYVDRLDTSSRIKDVTSGKRSEAFRWRGRFTIGCKLYIVFRRTLSASPAGAEAESGSVIDHAHAPRLNPL